MKRREKKVLYFIEMRPTSNHTKLPTLLAPLVSICASAQPCRLAKSSKCTSKKGMFMAITDEFTLRTYLAFIFAEPITIIISELLSNVS